MSVSIVNPENLEAFIASKDSGSVALLKVVKRSGSSYTVEFGRELFENEFSPQDALNRAAEMWDHSEKAETVEFVEARPGWTPIETTYGHTTT